MSPKPSTKTSADVRHLHRAHVFPSVANYYDESIVLDEGSGSRVTDLDGRTYLDFFGGILTVSLGHGHPRVTDAIVSQVRRLGHVSTLYPTTPMVELAAKLAAVSPGQLEKVFFSTSGTEANETAVALAQVATGNTELIALRHGYSGRSLLGQTLTGHTNYRVTTSQIASIKHAHAPYCYRCPFKLSYPSCNLACADDIEELIRTTTTGRVAGMLAEPILGVGGFVVAPPGYLQRAASIVRKYGGLFIIDEVQTGIGRTGDKLFGIDHHGVEPDIITMAKGIANGMPLGVTLATAAVADTWKGGNISTFGGNPVSSAAALATLDTVLDENLPANAAAMGAVLRSGLEYLKAKYPRPIGDVRGMGLMQAIELVRDERGGDRTPAPELALKLFEETKKRGLLIGKGGLYANVIRIAPALNIGRTEVDDALRILDESFAAIAGDAG